MEEEEEEGENVGGFLPLPHNPTASVPQLSLWNDRMSLSLSSHDTDHHKPGRVAGAKAKRCPLR